MKVFAILIVVFAITVASEAHVRKNARKQALDSYNFSNDNGDQCVCIPNNIPNVTDEEYQSQGDASIPAPDCGLQNEIFERTARVVKYRG